MTVPLIKTALTAITSGLALTLAALPVSAQLTVTGGNATLSDTDVFIPSDGTINDATGAATGDTDTRAVIYESTLQEEGFLIQTLQGDIPTNAIFRLSTLPVIQAAGNGGEPTLTNLPANLVDSTGNILGTLSLRSISPGGPTFVNIPTTLDFQVSAFSNLTNSGDLTEFINPGWILQETGFVVDAPSAAGVVQRRTPVRLVQYQPGTAPPGGTATAEDQVVLGNLVPSEGYTPQPGWGRGCHRRHQPYLHGWSHRYSARLHPGRGGSYGRARGAGGATAGRYLGCGLHQSLYRCRNR
ncbi:hypothetical protein XM38_049980 [Halomicronema hongdechloris C2206]|uniref:Uncharacterized protein n=1 Tax=Halomicronema hongdechloris C2206 TaxID=1641165 RepID=A0A1Z3HUP0_9CYAN|nr:hypothetical protein [Halomicronema hongdechloris]ASC74024.1 hypothetical protein XM38_049980 [Halomicronema hongdechloris C2206]